ncbi:hypothetical protein KC327_g52 [Hortaea werneckii]|nr:hypothetical protein KC327_g52 [Hortaea werneckii]
MTLSFEGSASPLPSSFVIRSVFSTNRTLFNIHSLPRPFLHEANRRYAIPLHLVPMSLIASRSRGCIKVRNLRSCGMPFLRCRVCVPAERYRGDAGTGNRNIEQSSGISGSRYGVAKALRRRGDRVRDDIYLAIFLRESVASGRQLTYFQFDLGPLLWQLLLLCAIFRLHIFQHPPNVSQQHLLVRAIALGCLLLLALFEVAFAFVERSLLCLLDKLKSAIRYWLESRDLFGSLMKRGVCISQPVRR